MLRAGLALLAVALADPLLAQTTCYTNPQGTTLCSTLDGVIQGNTSEIGQSVYRDNRGQQLDHQVDPFGNATVTGPDGEVIKWTQGSPTDRNDPHRPGSYPLPASPPKPASSAVTVPPRPPGL